MTINNCCENCFQDPFLIEFIKENGSIGFCGFCGSSDVMCVLSSSPDLGELFLPFFSLYTPAEFLKPVHGLKTDKGKFIWEIIQSDWHPFNDSIDSKTLLLEIAFSLGLEIDESLLFNSFVLNENEYLGDAVRQEEQLTAWDLFSEKLRVHNRFFPSKTVDLNKLDLLFQSLRKRIYLSEDNCFYRARNSYAEEKEFLISEMGMPPPGKTPNGRANPVGISYLYLASDENTAIAEIRPFMNDNVTIGMFRPIEDLSLVDLRDVSPFQFSKDEEFEGSINQISYLKKLGLDLSKPVNPKDVAFEYLPTQYLCEHIKKSGWDGVMYKSSLGDGYNLAIFEESLKCDSTKLVKMVRTNTNYEYIDVD